MDGETASSSQRVMRLFTRVNIMGSDPRPLERILPGVGALPLTLTLYVIRKAMRRKN